MQLIRLGKSHSCPCGRLQVGGVLLQGKADAPQRIADLRRAHVAAAGKAELQAIVELTVIKLWCAGDWRCAQACVQQAQQRYLWSRFAHGAFAHRTHFAFELIDVQLEQAQIGKDAFTRVKYPCARHLQARGAEVDALCGIGPCEYAAQAWLVQFDCQAPVRVADVRTAFACDASCRPGFRDCGLRY